MTREIKLALILGCALVLVVGVLISDHFSGARRTPIVTVGSEPLTMVSRGDEAASRQPRGEPVRTLAAAPANTELSKVLTDPNPAPRTEPVGDTEVAMADPVERQAQTLIAAQDQRLLEEAQKQGVDLAAQAPAADKAVPVAKEHTVKAGETLWEIAQKHYGDGSQYRRIVEANRDRLGSGKMAAGLKLRIPPKSPAPAATAAIPAAKTEAVALKTDPAAKPDPAKPDAKTTDKKRVYTVREGDTLAKIAERTLGSRTRARELASINNLRDPDDISVGLELRLPTR